MHAGDGPRLDQDPGQSPLQSGEDKELKAETGRDRPSHAAGAGRSLPVFIFAPSLPGAIGHQ